MASLTPTTPMERRSFSLPATRPATTPDSQIEVLFNLPNARIVSFTTSGSSSKPNSRPGSSHGSPVVDGELGTLSWVSKYESQIAIGPLRIYRAPGSVAFLSCSSALKPILPKSQCWEVDDVDGKFVLQIRPPQYWRIEVPNKTSVEKTHIEAFKDVLGKVLQFEKTPCPFQRNFTVALPESPATPIKKRPWRPVARPKLELSPLSKADATFPPFTETREAVATEIKQATVKPLPPSPETSQDDLAASDSIPEALTTRSVAPESDNLIDRRNSVDEPVGSISEDTIMDFPVASPSETTSGITFDESIFKSFSAFEDDEDSYSDATDDSNVTPRNILQPQFVPVDKTARPQALESYTRSITAPPLLSLVTSPPSKPRTQSPLRISTSADSDSDVSSSTESFHTVQSWHSPLEPPSPLAPPSPPASASSSPTCTYPYPHENIVLPKRMRIHTRESSEITATPETPQGWEASAEQSMDECSQPRTPTTTNGMSQPEQELFQNPTPPATIRSKVRHRATTSSNSNRRELSPLPAAINLFSPQKGRNKTARHLPTAIIQKTCEILLSPPSHLFQVMMNIASKIAAGEWRGFLSGYGDSVHWDFEEEYAGVSDSWTEDDFGVMIPNRETQPARPNTNSTGGSWEVD